MINGRMSSMQPVQGQVAGNFRRCRRAAPVLSIRPLGRNLATAQVKAGKLRALAVTTAKRLSFLPDLPTVIESGLPGFENFEMVSWYGVWGPPGMPKEIADRLSSSAAKAIRSKLAEERLSAQNFLAVGSTSAELAGYVASETAKYRQLVSDAKIKKE